MGRDGLALLVTQTSNWTWLSCSPLVVPVLMLNCTSGSSGCPCLNAFESALSRISPSKIGSICTTDPGALQFTSVPTAWSRTNCCSWIGCRLGMYVPAARQKKACRYRHWCMACCITAMASCNGVATFLSGVVVSMNFDTFADASNILFFKVWFRMLSAALDWAALATTERWWNVKLTIRGMTTSKIGRLFSQKYTVGLRSAPVRIGTSTKAGTMATVAKMDDQEHPTCASIIN
mmetsp:Transcript_27889/g.46138  ORF Transcript_27889/g.46138 Transcript_27889/m.46138 type:complete len:234 (+) Transcript_27889:402-1103(+)